MTRTDWRLWRKCTTCHAEAGQPCRWLTGTVTAGHTTVAVDQPMNTPHRSRKPRTGGAR